MFLCSPKWVQHSKEHGTGELGPHSEHDFVMKFRQVERKPQQDKEGEERVLSALLQKSSREQLSPLYLKILLLWGICVHWVFGQVSFICHSIMRNGVFVGKRNSQRS